MTKKKQPLQDQNAKLQKIFDLFSEATRKWAKKLLMTDWTAYLGIEEDKTKWATSYADAESKTIRIYINPDWETWGNSDSERKRNIDRTALHELIHGLLSGMRNYYEEFISQRNLNLTDLTEAQMMAYIIHEEYATEHFVRIFTHRRKKKMGPESLPLKSGEKQSEN